MQVIEVVSISCSHTDKNMQYEQKSVWVMHAMSNVFEKHSRSSNITQDMWGVITHSKTIQDARIS